MEILLSSITNMWRNGGKHILGELIATDEGLIFNKRGFLATYTGGGLVKGLAELATTKLAYLVLPYDEIKTAVKGKFRLNRKALIVTLLNGEEIIFAISDRHKEWFSLMDQYVNNNTKDSVFCKNNITETLSDEPTDK